MLGIEGAHPGRQFVAQVEAVQLALVALHRGPWPVAGQLQQGVFAAQLPGPVVQLALALAGFQPLALPHAVVQVLHRQGFQGRFAVVEEGFVQRAQLAGEDVHGPAFGDDVVQGQDEVMLLLAGLDQAGAQQGAGLQVEGLMRFAVRQLLQALLPGIRGQGREVLPGHAQAGVGMHLLVGHAIDAGEGGAQGFVTQDQRLQRGLEAAHVEHARQPRHATDVVGRAVGLHLPEEPHALLGIGQRHRLAAVYPGNRRLLVARAGLLDQQHLLGKGPQFAGFEQRPQRQFDVAGLAGAGNDLGRQQRMPAQGEEVILEADPWLTQHFAPDLGDLPFQIGARFDVLAHLPLRLRQGPAIQLAAGAQGHGVQAQQLRRHHVLRQLGGQGGCQPSALLGFIFVAGLGGVVADQLRAGDGVPHQHRGLGHAVLGQQPRFDFLRLDPKAPQLDLLVEAAEVFQHAVGAPAYAVTGAVQARALLTQGVDHKAFGGQRRASQVTPGQALAADAQLAGHPGGHQIELGIQHPAQHIAQRPANGRALAVIHRTLPMGDVDRGFGGAVAVVQLRVGQLLQ